MPNPDQTTAFQINNRYLAKALAWIHDHGDLVDFDCPNHLPPILFREMRDRLLIEVVAEMGLPYQTIWYRVQRAKWPIDKALLTPIKGRQIQVGVNP